MREPKKYSARSRRVYRGTKTPEDAAAVIARYATLDDDGPSGGFFAEEGNVPW